MQRDMELIREILLGIETSEPKQGLVRLKLSGRDNAEVSYHVMLLAQAGLIDAIDMSSSAGSSWIPKSLTWEGHDFLDAARNDTVWKKAMTTLKDKSVSVPFEIVKAVVMKTCKDFFGLG